MLKLTQKSTKIGNSWGMIIPASVWKETGLKPGENLVLEVSEPGKLIILGKEEKIQKKAVARKDFENWVDQFLSEDAEILDELAIR